ncbi:MAG: sodium:proton antiporter NhaD [Bacteroidales bacterium]|jgi:Na+/H+ antiporter NhaD/arsenite permease-like protein|nr:sodium:proton antiporter NhaD [Bacteroidales bacterium]
MFIAMIVLFLVGYTIIALEHPLKINKTATALLLGVLLWVFATIGGEEILVNTSSLREYLMANPGSTFTDWLVHFKLIHALGEVSEIIFFLLGAMTIVEIVDTQGGFKIITDKIQTTNKVKLLWILSILTFFMSAALDNLTTSIVMVALLRKLISEKRDRWFYASMVIIAANAGGAWSPIGDVTTIMLWIAGKVSTLNIIEMTFMASLMSLIVPLVVLSFVMKGEVKRPELGSHCDTKNCCSQSQSIFFLCLGVGALLFVPIFKTITHLPPYIGMLGGLGLLWVASEIVHRKDCEEDKSKYGISNVIKKIDVPSILFFLGILIAVNALATVGHLGLLSAQLDSINLPEPEKYYLINIIIGILSSIVDNVPLVAGAMGMYFFPMDHYFWEFLAYCAGTGGSILIIGSAAGVAVMGMEKIDFIWYLKKISWIALIGYFAGAATFIGEKTIRTYFGGDHHAKSSEVTLTKEGVKEYLSKHTFYIVQTDDENKYKDSTSLQFCNYNDYYGITINSIQKQNDTVYLYDKASNLVLSDFVFNKESSDTVANVMFGDNYLMVTKSGMVYLITQDGNMFPLEKME